MTNDRISLIPAAAPCVAFAILLLTVPISAQESRPTRPASIFVPDDPDRMPLPSTTPRAKRFFDVLDIVKKSDPMRDDNVVEQMAVALEAVLRRISQRDLSDVADSVRFTFPDQDSLTETYRDTTFTVSRTRVTPNSKGSEARIRLEEMFPKAQGLPAGPGTIVSEAAEPSVLSIEAIEDGKFSALVSWTISFAGSNGSHTQINTRWHVVFSRRPAPMIEDIRTESWERITARRPIFVDRTMDVLSGATRLLETMKIGGEAAYETMDRLLGTDLLGHTGIAVGDVNGDGLDDVYVCRGGGIPNSLLIHQRDGTVIDTAEAAGVDFLDLTRSALLVDMDGDGDRDLSVAIRNATLIYANDGQGNFGTEPAFASRSPTSSDFYSMAAADYDKDGLVDLYAVRYVQGSYGLTVPLPYFDAKNGPPNRLLRNLGGWKFEDVTSAVGLDDGNDRFSLAAAWQDIDDDGDQDLFVANDFGRSNLYLQENGKFKDLAEERGALNIAAGMGISYADFDLDGAIDFYVSNMYSASGVRIMSHPEYRAADGADRKRLMMGHVAGNALFRGKGGGRFENVSERARPEVGGWSWGAVFVDINGDGFEDIVVPNGNLTGSRPEDVDSLFWRKTAAKSPWTATPSEDYANGWAAQSILMQAHYSWAGRQRNATYLNCGDGTFADISAISGFGSFADARAVAVTDWDKDGDLDLWVKNRTAPELQFFENRPHATNDGTESDREKRPHFIAFKLRTGEPGVDAVGAEVFLKAGGKNYRKALRAGDGYLAQSSSEIVFGLGTSDTVEAVRVRWPRGDEQTFTIKDVDRRYLIVQGKGSPEAIERVEAEIPRSDASLRPKAEVRTERDGYAIELFDRPPLPNMKIEIPGGGAIATEKRLGKPYALLLWSAKSPRSMAALGKIVASRDALKSAGVEILPLTVDPPDEAEATKAMAATVDPTMPILRADPAMLDFVDVLQQDVLARTDDLFLPTTIVVDRLGMITALHRGRAEAGEIVRSAQRPRQERAPYPGRIVFSAARNYAFFATELRQRKRGDMADFFAAVDRRMRAQSGTRR